jgi:indolepyruvate ferredoxin oxidoreductase alpha subunit
MRYDQPLSPRLPSLCPGCPHRTVFTILRELGVVVSGDIGCYTLGVLPPYSAMDTCVEMGASLGVAQGLEIAGGPGPQAVAVIGDSTFAHSGVTGLLNAAYNGRTNLVIVLDNGTTAMTGMQPNPLSGARLDGSAAPALDYEKLAGAVGIAPADFRTVDAYKPEEVAQAIREMLAAKRLALLVVRGLCIIERRKKKA